MNIAVRRGSALSCYGRDLSVDNVNLRAKTSRYKKRRRHMSATPLAKIGRAAALALVLAGSSLAAMPAQASHMSGHPGFSVEFGFGFGDRFDDHDRRFCDLLSLR